MNIQKHTKTFILFRVAFFIATLEKISSLLRMKLIHPGVVMGKHPGIVRSRKSPEDSCLLLLAHSSQKLTTYWPLVAMSASRELSLSEALSWDSTSTHL